MSKDPEFVKILAASDIADNTVKVVEACGRRIAVCRVGDEYFAVADLCTHDNGPLGEGELIDHQIECPRHGARFDIKSGKALCLPAVLPVPTYKIEVRGDDIYVEIR